MNFIRVTFSDKPPSSMSSDIAMKTLGLKVGAHGEGTKKGKAKTLNDYSEDDILHAFQSESATLGLYGLNS